MRRPHTPAPFVTTMRAQCSSYRWLGGGAMREATRDRDYDSRAGRFGADAKITAQTEPEPPDSAPPRAYWLGGVLGGKSRPSVQRPGELSSRVHFIPVNTRPGRLLGGEGACGEGGVGKSHPRDSGRGAVTSLLTARAGVRRSTRVLLPAPYLSSQPTGRAGDGQVPSHVLM